MRAPLSWLREFVDVGVEPKQLAEDLTRVGLAVDAIERLEDDVVFDIDVTTNRVDCMNLYGVAREVAVIYDLPLRPLDVAFTESGPLASLALEVAVEAAELCPRFCVRILDVRIGPSPGWLRARLEKLGVRPISNVVDLTNYVMMEMGQPCHAFDLAKLPGARLEIRWGREGETLTTLDEVERELGPRTGVVAGPAGALALAGIMGGASSEVSETTRTVALEAAYWEPLAIRRAAKALGMHTEASHRFERGADPEAPPTATARLAHLLEKIGAGSTRPGLIDRVASARPRRTAVLRPAKLRGLLGVEVPEARARQILSGLGFGAGPAMEIPSWRGDVSREADLIEEVGRHYGVDRIPSTLPPSHGAEGLRPWQARERAVRETLVGCGLTEVVNYAFVSSAASQPDPAPRVALENPISEEQDVLRSSLAFPGLLGNLATNLRQGRRDVRIFEIGRVFAIGVPLPREERRLAILLAGAAAPHWSAKGRLADFFDAKGLLDALALRLGLGALGVEATGFPGFLHPGKAAVLRAGRGPIGWLGALHPDIAGAHGLKDESIVAEIALDGILEGTQAPARFEALPRFPEVARDLSILCDAALPAREIEAQIRGAAGAWLRAVQVTDRYVGKPIPEGKTSLTFALRYQHAERTLAGEEVQGSVDAVVAELKRVGVEIRGE